MLRSAWEQPSTEATHDRAFHLSAIGSLYWWPSSRAPRPPAVIRLLEVDGLALRAAGRPLDRVVVPPPLDRHVPCRFPDLPAGGVDNARLVSRSRSLEVPFGRGVGRPPRDPGAHGIVIRSA